MPPYKIQSQRRAGTRDLCTPVFTPWKEPRYHLNRELCGVQNRFGRSGEERNVLVLPGFELRIVQPVA